MFYGSTNSETVLTELTPEIGDKIHIGVTATNPDKPPRVTAIGEIDYSRRYGRPLIGNLSTYKIQNELLIRLKEQDQNRHLRVLLVDAYFTDIFSKPAYKERDYKVTSCLSELLLNIEINVDGRDITQDGFAYPSVAHRGGLNYAIAPSSFDEKFRWEKFISGEIVNYFGFGLYALKQNAEADTFEADGTINWRQL